MWPLFMTIARKYWCDSIFASWFSQRGTDTRRLDHGVQKKYALLSKEIDVLLISISTKLKTYLLLVHYMKYRSVFVCNAISVRSFSILYLRKSNLKCSTKWLYFYVNRMDIFSESKEKKKRKFLESLQRRINLCV